MNQPDDAFERALATPVDEPLDVDREALRFIRSWHQYEPLREPLTYHGVNLGAMMETRLLWKVVPIVARQFRERGEP